MNMDRETRTRDTGFTSGTTMPGEMHTGDSDGGTMDKARGKAREFASEAKENASERIETRKHQAADTLSNVARSLRESGDGMVGEEAGAGRAMRQVADQVDRFAGYIESRDVGQMLDQVEDFARHQPAAFVGGAFTLGLIGARFLKSSRDRLEHDEMRGQWDNRRLPETLSDFDRQGYETPGTFSRSPMGSPAPGTYTPGSTTPGSTTPPYDATEGTRDYGYAASSDADEGFDEPRQDNDPDRRIR